MWLNSSVADAELLADALDVAVDGAVVDVDVLAVRRVDQLVAAFHHAGTRGQRLDQQELRDRQLDVVALPRALVLGLVQHQVAARHHPAGRGARPLCLAGLVAPQQRSDPLQQQALAERLGDIVVGAQAQAHQLIDLLVLRGQEDDRHGAALAQPLQQFHPVHARHLDVEHGEIDRPGGQALQRAFAVGVGADGEALLLQRHRHAGQDVAVVVDQGDGLLHRVLLEDASGSHS